MQWRVETRGDPRWNLTVNDPKYLLNNPHTHSTPLAAPPSPLPPLTLPSPSPHPPLTLPFLLLLTPASGTIQPWWERLSQGSGWTSWCTPSIDSMILDLHTFGWYEGRERERGDEREQRRESMRERERRGNDIDR